MLFITWGAIRHVLFVLFVLLGLLVLLALLVLFVLLVPVSQSLFAKFNISSVYPPLPCSKMIALEAVLIVRTLVYDF